MLRRIAAAFRRILHDLPPAMRRQFWAVMALTGLAALTEFLLAGMVSLLGVTLATPGAISQSRGARALLDHFPALGPWLTEPRLLLALITGCLAVAVLLKSGFLAFLTWRQSAFSQDVSRNFCVRLYRGYLVAPYLWHTRQSLSNLMTLIAWNVHVGNFLFSALQMLSWGAVCAILVLAIFCMAPLASLIILCVTGVAAWLTMRFSRHWVNKYSREATEIDRERTGLVNVCLMGIREITLHQQGAAFDRRFDDAARRQARCRAILPVFPPLPSWVLEFVGVLLLFGTVLLLIWQGASLTRISAAVALLAAVAWRLLPIMNRIVANLITMQQLLPPIDLFMAKLDEVLPFGALPEAGEAPALPLTRELALRDVSFRYPPEAENAAGEARGERQGKDALSHMDLTIPAGAMVGLVGSSGAGKSTVVGLLAGLYPPSGGAVVVDGRALGPGDMPGWMRGIGYVPQSPFLLNASLAENIAFSAWGGEPDRERVLRCCRMAAMDFLDELEDGIDTVIGERGVRLSGGQLQRVSIARALYAQPQLIIFDEATSALDGASELAIQNTIAGLRANMTVIMVAHRLSTVRHCDRIYWIDGGRVRMAGTPDEVLPAYERYLAERAARAPGEPGEEPGAGTDTPDAGDTA